MVSVGTEPSQWLIMNFFLYFGIFLSFNLNFVNSLPLFLHQTNICHHGICPVLPIPASKDPSTYYCPPRYRLNLDICLPTKELCEDAHKHGLFCTTSTKIFSSVSSSSSARWFFKSNVYEWDSKARPIISYNNNNLNNININIQKMKQRGERKREEIDFDFRPFIAIISFCIYKIA